MNIFVKPVSIGAGSCRCGSGSPQVPVPEGRPTVQEGAAGAATAATKRGQTQLQARGTVCDQRNHVKTVQEGQDLPTSSVYSIEEGLRQKKRQRSSLLFGGNNFLNSLLRWLFCTGRFELHKG